MIKPTILVVDDEQEQVAHLMDLLAPHYAVIGCTTYREAVAALGKRAAHGGSIVDVVVIDSNVVPFPNAEVMARPDPDKAFELMRQVRSVGVLVPWLICSGRPEIPGDVVNDSGCVGYVHKDDPDADKLLLHYVAKALKNNKDRIVRADTPVPAIALTPSKTLTDCVIELRRDLRSIPWGKHLAALN